MKIIFSQKHEYVLEQFKALAKRELPEWYDEILFTTAPAQIPGEEREPILEQMPAFVGSLFYENGNTFYNEYIRTAHVGGHGYGLPAILFTTTSVEHERDQIVKYAVSGKNAWCTNIIVVPKTEENFIFMVKTICEGDAGDDIDKNWYVKLRKKFTYIETKLAD